MIDFGLPIRKRVNFVIFLPGKAVLIPRPVVAEEEDLQLCPPTTSALSNLWNS